jgi:hypothetical protein
MPTSIQKFIDSKNLPAFLAKNKVLLSFDKVSKVFPGLGLPNCKEDAIIDNSRIIVASASVLINMFVSIFNDARYRINNKRYEIIPDKTKQELNNWNTLLYKMSTSLYVNDAGGFTAIHNDDGKISLKLPYDIAIPNTSITFKKNESLFKVYNKVYRGLQELNCGITIEKLDSMLEFKRFSSDNLPSNHFQIVFSSDGVDGLWDIATMSMRGISSCQSWTGGQRNALVGSLVDPFVGVIYLTSGTKFIIGANKRKQDMGSKMIRRSLVRFAINSTTKKPFLIVDRMYPEFDKEIVKEFISFIKKRVDDRIDVVFGPEISYDIAEKAYIPDGKLFNKLTDTTRSYRDTKIPFQSEVSVSVLSADQSLLTKNIANKKAKFRNILRNTSFVSMSGVKKSSVDFKNAAIQKSVKSILHGDDFKFLVRAYYYNIANQIIETGPKDSEALTSKDYMRSLCYHYIKNKNTTILSGAKRHFTKSVNLYFKKRIKTKVNSKILSKVLKTVQKSIDDAVKNELKKLFVKKKVVSKLPN